MQKRTKGDRLNWTPISEVKPVKLTDELTEGRVVAHSNEFIKTKCFLIK